VNYPHRLRLYTPNAVNAGVQDTATGAFDTTAAGAPVILYDNQADVQEQTKRVSRTEGGEPTLQADAAAYLSDETALRDARIESGVLATITWEDGQVSEAIVMAVRRLDGVVTLRRL
jgi:hypothetical protein